MSAFLAIETSQRIGSVALRAESATIHIEYLHAGGGRHGDDLLPAIERVFRRLDLKPGALEAVAVSIGPGSFTGLRVAVSTAKMLAETLKAKVIAVPSALVAAENLDPAIFTTSRAHPLARSSPCLLVALASKRDTFWATRLRRMGGSWIIEGEPGLDDAASFDLAGISALVADEHLPDKARSRATKAKLSIVEPAFDASACLRVAERLVADLGDAAFADPLALLPLYPREPEAVSIWEQREKKLPKTR